MVMAIPRTKPTHPMVLGAFQITKGISRKNIPASGKRPFADTIRTICQSGIVFGGNELNSGRRKMSADKAAKPKLLNVDA